MDAFLICKNRSWLIFWAWLSVNTLFCPAFGQEALLRVLPLTSEQGLSQTTNSFIYKDSKGFIWISSVDGLNCFYGTSVKIYRPNANDPWSICGSIIQSSFFEDSTGDIWFSTEEAINCFRRRRGNFDHYYLDKSIRETGDYTLHQIFFLEQRRYLWSTANGRLYRFDTWHPQNRTAHQYLHELQAGRWAVDTTANGSVRKGAACFWDYGPGFEIVNYNPKGKVLNRDTMFAREGLPASFLLTVRQALIANDTLIWFATNLGLLEFNPLKPKQYELHVLSQSDKGIRSIQFKSKKQLWVVSNGGHLYSFDCAKHKYENALVDNLNAELSNIYSLMTDDDGRLWYSIDGEGVHYSKIARRQFGQPLLGQKIEEKGIFSIFENKPGQIYCWNEKGKTFCLDKEKNLLQEANFPGYSKFYRSKTGSVWNISEQGLASFTPSGRNLRNHLSADKAIFYDIVANDREDGLFIGTNHKVIQVSSNDFSINEISSLPEGTMALLFDHSGYLWTGGVSQEVSVWNVKENEGPILIHRTAVSGLVNHIVEDLNQNCVWIGTGTGLFRVWKEGGMWHDSLLTEREGLPNQYIYAIVLDKKGSLWLSTNQGIIKYMPYKPIGQQFKQYTTRNGLSSNEYNPGSALMSSTGEIWFGSTKGVDVFHPDSISDSSKPPKLAIVGLKVHDQAWPWDTTATTCIEMAERIELAYNENTLRLELAAMEYTDPEMNKFRVWLSKDGGKPDTVELGTQNFITYANLRPGNYVFQFTACNSEGIWQETPRRLEIIITPHFSDTWQFKAFVAVLALAFIGFATAFYYRYRLRLQQLALEKQQREAERKQLLLENELALQEERNRIADEMHDELGGGLSTIRLASQRAKKVQSPEELQTILKRVSQISIGLVNNMRGIIWAMDSQNDSLRSLLAYIRQYAGTFLDDNGIAATLSLPSDFPEHSLSSQYRHNVMLTVKECLNNILKHADATAVELRASVDDQLLITIQDNGKGFEPTEHAGMGKGLRTTVKRMESVGGSIEWRRNVEGGMTIVLIAPLP